MHLPVVVAIRSSRYLRVLLWGAHGLAATCVFPLDVDWAVRFGLTGLIAFSLYACLTRPQPISGLCLGRDGGLAVTTKVGAGGTATILPETVVFPRLIVLVMRLEGKRIPLVLLPDALSPEDNRRLRVWLNWRRT